MGSLTSSCKSRRLDGRIIHLGEPFAARLNGGVFEWSNGAGKSQLVRAALRAGAIMEKRRRAISEGIEPLPLRVYCLGVTTRVLNMD